ncbi:MAG: flagellar export chaperone FlgN [Thermoguttaceae bacterium]
MQHDLDMIFTFLNQLAQVQERALAVLTSKQSLLIHPDKEKLIAISKEEQEVVAALHEMEMARNQILEDAKMKGYESDSLRSFIEQIAPQNIEMNHQIKQAEKRSRDIRFVALANWTMTQKSIVHLSQMLELIETRGQGKTTYKRLTSPEKQSSGGGLVDRIA